MDGVVRYKSMIIDPSTITPCELPTSKKFIDLTGKTFGTITALHHVGRKVHIMFWMCECSCGDRRIIGDASLRTGIASCWKCKRTTSCMGEASRFREETTEHRIWRALKQRCLNKNCPAFPDYGGRGIAICERWSDYRNFLSDMGRRPSKEHTIDRIDNNRNYEPGNCRWATRIEQANNTRSCHLLTFNGETLSKAAWARKIGMQPGAFMYRIKKFGLEKAITMPKTKCIK